MRGGNDGSEDGSSDEDTSDSGPGKKEDIRAANLRKTRAEANLKELQLGRLRGEVISIPDAKTRLDRMFGNLRSALLSMAPKLVTRLDGVTESTACEAAIRDEMEALCRDISTGAILGTDPDQGEDAEEALEISASAEEPQPVFLPADFGFE